MWAQKSVTLVVDGTSSRVRAHASTVAELLAEEDVRVGPSDLVNPGLESDVRSGSTIVVRHAVPVEVKAGGRILRLDVVGETVADALVAAGLDPSHNAGVEPPLATPLRRGMVICVPDLLVRVESERKPVPSGVLHKKDYTLRKGAKRVLERGHPGRLLRVYRVLVSGGVESTPVLTAEHVLEKPRPKVIAVGAAPRIAAVARGGRSDAAIALRVVATGYSAEQPGLDSTTATGALATHGVVAVDPSVIALGSRLYVPGYGLAIAADTGGAIRGPRIDLCFDTVGEALAWGRRSVTVYVLH